MRCRIAGLGLSAQPLAQLWHAQTPQKPDPVTDVPQRRVDHPELRHGVFMQLQVLLQRMLLLLLLLCGPRLRFGSESLLASGAPQKSGRRRRDHVPAASGSHNCGQEGGRHHDFSCRIHSSP
jgi:hypothetical protein